MYMSKGKARKVKGFTLIELMIVVAIVAILAAVAYPSYTNQVRKSRRAQAKADLVELAQQAERYHTVNNSFADFDLGTTSGTFAQSPREGGTARYTLSTAGAPTQSTYTLQAVPQGDQAKDKCGTLSITQAGVKGSTGAAVSECW